MSNVVALRSADGYQPAAAADPSQAAGPDLDTYKRLFRESRDLTQRSRLRSMVYARYYHGKQLDPRHERTLKLRNEPTFVINRVRPGIEGMVGVVDKGQSDPRAYPRNDPDEASAEMATDCLRYVADANRWKPTKLKVFRNELVEGTAAVLIEVDDKLEVKLRRIRWEEFFYDPYSREEDFSDASYMGVAKWQYLDAVRAAYPEFAAQLAAVCASGEMSDSTWEDRPFDHGVMWSDPRRKRLLVVEMYHLYAGAWMKCVFVGSLKLEEGPSPYQDNDGKPCCPIEAQSAFVDEQNHRYGAVEDMIGPQDEINVYRRKAAWLATFRQLQERDATAAQVDPDEARAEAARPDGVIPSGWQVVDNAGRFSLDQSLLAEAKGEIERLGPNPAILGRQGADSSGRANLIRQQAGLTELAHLFAGLEDLERRVFKQVWARIRQFWTEPKLIRVTDTEGAMKFITVNEPVYGPPLPVMDPQTGMPVMDPVTRQVKIEPQLVGYRNTVAQIDVDIIIDSTPDTANVQQEQYAMLVDLARVGGLGPNPGPMLLQASSLPRKREIMDELKDQQQQPPSPEQQAAGQLELRGRAAEVAKTEGQAMEAHARAAKYQREAMTGEAPTTAAPQQPPSPLDQVKAVNELRSQQADIDKTFAQADHARALAAKAVAETRSNLYAPPAPLPEDQGGGF